MSDYLKPTKSGDLSSKVYKQGDRKLFRYERLSYSFHKEPMGGGTGRVVEPGAKHKDWRYPLRNSVDELVLQQVCGQ